jgi:hypothetical protein
VSAEQTAYVTKQPHRGRLDVAEGHVGAHDLLVAHNLLGRTSQWPSITAGGMRVRDDVDSRSWAFITMASGNKEAAARKEPANYWFDRRHVEQFDLRVQSFRTVEGEVLTLIRLLDAKMIEIYG